MTTFTAESEETEVSEARPQQRGNLLGEVRFEAIVVDAARGTLESTAVTVNTIQFPHTHSHSTVQLRAKKTSAFWDLKVTLRSLSP